jgi:hypothetical protein
MVSLHYTFKIRCTNNVGHTHRKRCVSDSGVTNEYRCAISVMKFNITGKTHILNSHSKICVMKFNITGKTCHQIIMETHSIFSFSIN